MKSTSDGAKKNFLFKIVLTGIVVFATVLFIVYFLKISGLNGKINSVDDLRDYISSLGGNAVYLVIVFQILQVVILPVPGVVSIGVAVAMFGALKGAVYSLIGILIGSFIAFFTGKFFGYKAVAWLIGKGALKKIVNDLDGKDKAFLTFAFLFPFFPDDALCFVAGISEMRTGYFSFIIIITRSISTFLTAFSFSGDLIPYDKAWGIFVWITAFFVTLIASRILYKKIYAPDKKK